MPTLLPHLLPKLSIKEQNRRIDINEKMAEAYQEIAKEYVQTHDCPKPFAPDCFGSDTWNEIMAAETKSYLHLAYYVRGYGARFVDVMRLAGVGDTIWQSDDSAMLAARMEQLSARELNELDMLIKSLIPDKIRQIDREGTYSHMQRLRQIFGMYPGARQPLAKLMREHISPQNVPLALAALRPHSYTTIDIPVIFDICRGFDISFAWVTCGANGMVELETSAQIEYMCARYSFLSQANRQLVWEVCGGRRPTSE